MAKKKIFCVINEESCEIKGAFYAFETAITLARAYSTVEDVEHVIKPISLDFIDFEVLGSAVLKNAKIKGEEAHKVIDPTTKIVV